MTLKRIVVGYDGSEPARRALDRTAEIAQSATVAVVCVARPLASDVRSADVLDPSDEQEQRRLLREARDRLAADGIAAATVAPLGDPADALIEAGKEAAADVLVVGSSGRNRLARFVLGSVSADVVERAPFDVLVVR